MKKRPIGDRAAVVCLAMMVAALAAVHPTHAGGGESEKSEKPIAMKDLPGPVRTSAEKAIAGGAVKRIVLEVEDGKNEYSVEATMSGKDKEFTFASDGALLAEEEDVAFASLPEAVRAAAGQYFGDTRGLRASSEISKGVTAYEVGGRKDGKNVSVRFSAGGALLDAEADED